MQAGAALPEASPAEVKVIKTHLFVEVLQCLPPYAVAVIRWPIDRESKGTGTRCVRFADLPKYAQTLIQYVYSFFCNCIHLLTII